NTYSGVTFVSAGTLVLRKSFTSGSSLTVDDGATVRLAVSAITPHNVLLRTSSLTTNTTGKLDLSDNKLIVSGGDIAAVAASVKSGLNISGALWTGTGINSSVAAADAAAHSNSTIFAVGAISNNGGQIGVAGSIYTSFGGESVTTADVLVRFTYFGDANLSGDVNSTDYFLIDNGFLNNRSGWINGDFDFSGTINSTDYFLIDNAFLNQGGALTPEQGFAGVNAVPEPAATALVAG